jgi:hypothetical protein
MTTRRSIPLVNPGAIADEYWVVHYTTSEHGWDILGIDIYWDAEHREPKAADIQFVALSVAVQTALLIELNDWIATKRRRQRRMMGMLFDLRAAEQTVPSAA